MQHAYFPAGTASQLAHPSARTRPSRGLWGLLLTALLLGLALGARAQTSLTGSAWADDRTAARPAPGAQAPPLRFRALLLNGPALQATLGAAPLENRAAGQAAPAGAVLVLPLPNGTAGRFRLVESPVLAPALAAQYPMIKTYAGVGLDDPTARLRCDFSPTGFHAQVLSPTTGAFYIEPVSPTDAVHYISYFRADVPQGPNMMPCGTTGTGALPVRKAQRPAAGSGGTSGPGPSLISAGTSLRVYNLAIGTPAEFATTYGSTAAAMSTITTVVNQVKGIMELELSVRLTLAATKIYAASEAATDIYTNPASHSQNVTDNQAGLTPALLGISSYDIGHVFTSSTSGGLATLNSVCNSSTKARGSTGFSVGSLSVVATTVFAHELGHQFGATHSFNSAEATACLPNRTASTAYEPGAGTTIMSYAAACSPDNSLQYGASPNFHVASFEQIQTFIASTSSCGTALSTGNTAPTITVPASGKTLPISTPFKLTAVGADANSDALTYSWEQFDLGSAALLTTAQVAADNVPLFRVRVPSTSPTRYFPALADVLAGTTTTSGDRLPTVTRDLTFRCGIRDQHNGTQGVVGGVNFSSDVSLDVTSTAGPFAVTAPNTAVSWAGNSTQTVTWSVNNTNVAPVNCLNVNIRLSIDGGTTFPYLLAGGTSNDGTQSVVLPNLGATYTTCRIQVDAADNYFYDIGNANFTLTPVTGPVATGISPTSGPVGTTITISGSGFGTSAAGLSVTVGGVAATITGTVTATSFQVVVPASALTGQVVVTKTGTGAGTANAGVFSVTPVISSITPSSAGAGTSITITGTSFSGVTGVTFANGVTVLASAFTSSSLTVGATNTVTFLVPATAGSGLLYITTAGGNSTGTNFTVNSFSITSRSPARNARTASATGTVGITFNQTPNTSTAAGTPIAIFSSQRGGNRNAAGLGTFSSSGTTVTYTPGSTGAFRPGEVVSVTATAAAANTGGATLPAEMYQFTVAAGKATGALGTAVSVTTGNRPQEVALGDINGDGHLDAVAANFDNASTTANTVSVRLGDGAGGLSGTTNLTVGTGPRTVVLADVNNDGKLDILVTCVTGTGTDGVYVYVRNATGTAAGDFTAGTTLTVSVNGEAGPGLAVADINNDGWLDVVMPGNYTTARFNVFLNAKTATGTFNSPTLSTAVTGAAGTAVALADLNNDGKADILYMTSSTGNVSVALGDGAGAFTAHTNVTVGTTPSGIAVGDLNEDGNLDFATANQGSNNVSIRLGNGAGGFTSPTTAEITVGSSQQPRGVALADINGDGHLDLVATNFFANPGRVSIRLGAGTGAFTAPATPEYNSGSQCYGVAVADLNNDAALDVVTANFGASAGTGGLSILLGVPVPVVTSISPTSGVTGTAVVISGTGFQSGSTATIGGVAITSKTVSTIWPPTISGVVAATTPIGAQPVVVTTGTQSSNTDVTFTVIPAAPTITSFSPVSGPVGTLVTINGTNFTGATAVTFNSTAASSFAVVSATQITATVATGTTTGLVAVTTAGGTATSSALATPNFTVTVPSSVATLSNLVPGTGSLSPAFASATTAYTLTTNAATITFTPTVTQAAATVKVNGTTVASGTASGAIALNVGTNTVSIVVTAEDGTTTRTYTVTVTRCQVVAAAQNIAVQLAANGTASITGASVNNGSTASCGFASGGGLSVSPSSFTCTNLGANSVTLTVTDANGYTSMATATVTITAPPTATLTNLSPSAAAPGATVTATGTNLSGATALTVNGVSATISGLSATSFTFVVPSGATNTGNVVVTAPCSQSVTRAFSILPAIAATGLNPTSGSVGTSVTITGTNLGSATSVSFNGGVQTTITSNTTTSLTVLVPASATTGTVTVTTAAGTSAASAQTFTVLASSPTITTLSPGSGAMGSSFTVTGTNLSGTTSVRLGGQPAAFVVNSATSLTVTVPRGASTHRVQVTTPGGTALSSAAFGVDKVNSYAFPVVTASFNSIDVGARSRPTLTDLDGDGLLDILVGEQDGNLNHYEQSAANSTSFTLVTASFNGINVGLNSAPTLTDLDGDGLLDMLVGELDGNLNHYEQNAANSTSFTLVTATFNGGLDVGFNSMPTFTDLDGDGLLDMLVGEGDGNLNHYEQSAANSTSFTLVTDSFNSINVGFISAPTLTDLDGDGLLDLLVGENDGNLNHYEQNAANSTSFTLVTDSFNGIDVGNYSTPTLTDLDGDGRLDMLVGKADGTLNHHEQVPVPVLSSLSPTSGPVGTVVTLTGTDFTGATGVSFNGAAATTFSVTNATTATATVPAGATTGNVTITTPGGASNGVAFTVLLPPTITALSPGSGAMGSSFTVTGTNLSGTTSVRLGGQPAAFVVNSATSLTVTVPRGASTHRVQVTTPGGMALSSAAFGVDKVNSYAFPVVTASFNSIAAGYSAPAVTDIDGDGLLDLLVGNSGGTFSHYEQSAANATTFSLVTATFSGLDAGDYSTPVVTDLDGDGLLDLLTGNFGGGIIKHYEQSALNATTFALVSANFNAISGGGRLSAPAVTDLDGNGLLDLVVGKEDGLLSRYEQDAANSTVFTLVTTSLLGVSVGSYSAPTFADLDGDGLLDLVVGNNNSGLIRHYEQSAVNSTTFSLVTNTFNSLSLAYPKPTFTDLDGDGLLDLLLGSNTNSGALQHYEQVPVPVLSSLLPTSGPVGTVVTLTGTDFTGATGVSFNGAAATTFSVTNATTATATVPAGATTGNVTITTPGGTSNGVAFTVTPSLSNLMLSAGTISPAFASGTLSYTLTVPGTTTSTTVTPTNAQTSGGTITVNGTTVASGAASAAINLTAGGTTTITVVVNAPGGGATRTYTVAVTRPTCVVTALARNVSVTLDASGNATVAASAVDNGSSSTCGTATPSLSQTAFSCTDAVPATVVSSLSFSGSNQYITLPATNTLPIGNAAYTLEAWIKPTSMGNFGIVGYGNYGTGPQVNAFRLFNDFRGTGLVNYWWGPDLAVPTANLADGQWHHVAATYDGTTRIIYVDGAVAGSDVPGVAHAVPDASNVTIAKTVGTEYFSGGLDEVRVWSVARTAAQINAAKNLGLPGATAGLAAYYRFNEGSGTTVSDATGTAANLGTFVGSPTWSTSAPAVVNGSPVTLTITDSFGGSATASATVTVSIPALTSTTWSGASSTSWTGCANWSYGQVPTATISAAMPAGMPRYATLAAGTYPVKDLTLASGSTLTTASGATLQLSGDFANNGATATLAGPVEFVGSAPQTVGGSSPTSFATVVVNKTSGTTLTLGRDLSISAALTLTSGTLTTTAAYKVALGSTATLTETAPSSSTGYVTGAVETTRLLNTAGTGSSFGGLGLTLTPAAASTALPGSTLVRRVTGTPLTNVAATRQGIGRYFDIQSTTTSGLNVTMVFGYRDAELGASSEANLALFKSASSLSGPWANQRPITLNATANTVSKAGISSFSVWTLGDANTPLPVELMAFTAEKQGNTVALKWRTATEVNSHHFDVERSLDGYAFHRLGSVAGQGTKASPTAYAWLDEQRPASATTLYYRLKQVDTDGTSAYSPVRVVQVAPLGTALTLFPNPTTAAVTVAGAPAGAAVTVFDALSRIVAQATADATGTARLALPPGLAAGVYAVRSGKLTQRLTVE